MVFESKNTVRIDIGPNVSWRYDVVETNTAHHDADQPIRQPPESYSKKADRYVKLGVPGSEEEVIGYGHGHVLAVLDAIGRHLSPELHKEQKEKR
jgi:hypothetical protein